MGSFPGKGWFLIWKVIIYLFYILNDFYFFPLQLVYSVLSVFYYTSKWPSHTYIYTFLKSYYLKVPWGHTKELQHFLHTGWQGAQTRHENTLLLIVTILVTGSVSISLKHCIVSQKMKKFSSIKSKFSLLDLKFYDLLILSTLGIRCWRKRNSLSFFKQKSSKPGPWELKN